MKTETYYCWKVYTKIEDELEPRLITPWADPRQHEFPFHFLADTPEKAYELLDTFGAYDEAMEEGWVLCKMALDPIEVADDGWPSGHCSGDMIEGWDDG